MAIRFTDSPIFRNPFSFDDPRAPTKGTLGLGEQSFFPGENTPPILPGTLGLSESTIGLDPSIKNRPPGTHGDLAFSLFGGQEQSAGAGSKPILANPGIATMPVLFQDTVPGGPRGDVPMLPPIGTTPEELVGGPPRGGQPESSQPFFDTAAQDPFDQRLHGLSQYATAGFKDRVFFEPSSLVGMDLAAATLALQQLGNVGSQQDLQAQLAALFPQNLGNAQGGMQVQENLLAQAIARASGNRSQFSDPALQTMLGLLGQNPALAGQREGVGGDIGSINALMQMLRGQSLGTASALDRGPASNLRSRLAEEQLSGVSQEMERGRAQELALSSPSNIVQAMLGSAGQTGDRFTREQALLALALQQQLAESGRLTQGSLLGTESDALDRSRLAEQAVIQEELRRLSSGGRVDPQTAALISGVTSQGIAEGQSDIERFQRKAVENILQQIAPSRGLRATDSPVVDLLGDVGEESVRQFGELSTGLRKAELEQMLAFPLRQAESARGSSGVITGVTAQQRQALDALRRTGLGERSAGADIERGILGDILGQALSEQQLSQQIRKEAASTELGRESLAAQVRAENTRAALSKVMAAEELRNNQFQRSLQALMSGEQIREGVAGRETDAARFGLSGRELAARLEELQAGIGAGAAGTLLGEQRSSDALIQALLNSSIGTRLGLAETTLQGGLGLAGIGPSGAFPIAGSGTGPSGGTSGSDVGAAASGIGALISAISSFSSRKLKDSYGAVKGGVLSRVARLPVGVWRYKGDKEKHIGPYAEDFAALFGVGDGVTINMMDAVGVLFAAVKELSEEVARLRSKDEPS